MRKILNGIVLFIILIMMSSTVFAGEKADQENKKRETVFKEALDVFMQEFTKEETPEEDKILSYEYSGHGWSEREEDGKNKIFASISFNVKPVNLENTSWYEYNNMCFAVFQIVDHEYVLERISRYPDNFDKFMERFEEYKKNVDNNHEKTVEVKSVQAKVYNNNAGLEIQKISIGIFGFCLIIFLIVFGVIISKIYKRKKF